MALTRCGTGPPASPKRAVSLKISDFSNADQDLLRAAFHSDVPMVLVGFKEGDTNPFLISLGHPDGLARAEDSPEGSRIYSLIRIKGVEPRPEVVLRAG